MKSVLLIIFLLCGCASFFYSLCFLLSAIISWLRAVFYRYDTGYRQLG